MTIAALIVTYNPDEKLEKLVYELSEDNNIVEILLFDNASKSLDRIKILENKYSQVKVIYSKENKGLAFGLNRLVELSSDVDFIITFDQDSYMKKGDVTQLAQSLINKHNKNNKYISIGPKICLNEKGYGSGQHKIMTVPFLITSGNLSYKYIYESVKYDEDFFIDSVDYDFSLKLRREYKLCQNRAIFLLQNLGETVDGKIVHSDKRMYYMLRNFIRLVKRHFWRYPVLIALMTVLFAKNYYTWMHETSDKQKVKKIIQEAFADV